MIATSSLRSTSIRAGNSASKCFRSSSDSGIKTRAAGLSGGVDFRSFFLSRKPQEGKARRQDCRGFEGCKLACKCEFSALPRFGSFILYRKEACSVNKASETEEASGKPVGCT